MSKDEKQLNEILEILKKVCAISLKKKYIRSCEHIIKSKSA
jgi:hypothetical protein